MGWSYRDTAREAGREAGKEAGREAGYEAGYPDGLAVGVFAGMAIMLVATMIRRWWVRRRRLGNPATG